MTLKDQVFNFVKTSILTIFTIEFINIDFKEIQYFYRVSRRVSRVTLRKPNSNFIYR